MIPQRNRFMRRLIFVSIALLGLSTSAYARAHTDPSPSDNAKAQYHRAFDAITDNNPQQAEAIIARGNDPILNKILTGSAMALPGNDYSFEQMNAFMTGNPGWPGLKGIQMIAEQKLPENAVPSQIVAWFNAHPPLTLTGFYRYIDALNQSGMADTATAAVRERWIDGDFTGDELVTFNSRYNTLLNGSAMWARMDRLLWKNDVVGARRMMPSIAAADQALAQARLALAAQDSNAENWLSRIPPGAQNDPGLLYQKLRWFCEARPRRRCRRYPAACAGPTGQS